MKCCWEQTLGECDGCETWLGSCIWSESYVGVMWFSWNVIWQVVCMYECYFTGCMCMYEFGRA